jgi:hypothetical protein
VFRAHGMIVLSLQGDRISAITRFVDNSNMAGSGCRGFWRIRSPSGWFGQNR